MSAFLLKDQKKSLAKEKSPAGEKLPEIHAQWRQELQHVLRFLFFRPLRYWQFLLIAIALNFLSAIFHRRVCFQKNILASDFDILSKLLLDFKTNLDRSTLFLPGDQREIRNNMQMSEWGFLYFAHA